MLTRESSAPLVSHLLFCLGTPATPVMKDSSYLAWKNWKDSSFGQLSKADSAYYSAELKRAGISRCSHSLAVLEIGFGNGQFLTYAANQGWEICGTEINEALLAEAKRRNFVVYGADFIESYQKSAFDLIVAFDVIEHISADQIREFFGGVTNILRSGGTFLARFPNADSPFGLEGQNGDPSHLNALGVGKIKYLAKQAGLEICFLGPAASPLLTGRLASTVRNILTRPLHLLFDLFVRVVFLPGSGVSFSSRNTTCILIKP